MQIKRRSLLRAAIALIGASLCSPVVAEQKLNWFSPRANSDGSWFFNVESVFLSADRDAGINSFALNDGGGVTYGPITQTLGSEEFTGSPRVSIGRLSASGWGVQLNWWEFTSGNSIGFAGLPATAITTPDLGIYAETARTRAYALDLELLKRFCFQNSTVLVNAGIRQGRINHLDSATAIGFTDEGDFHTLNARSEVGFEGTGFTYGMQAQRNTAGPVSLFASGRLSHLFGQNEASASTSAMGSGPSGFTNAASAAVSELDESLFIAETQFGAIWQRQLKSTGGRMFAKIGFEFQYWNSPDLPATSANFASFAGSRTDVASTANDLQTRFLGLVLGAGYAW
ncbi:MAG: Lpg1974 family pore-forming outer membrane protein [Pirellulaceae bacterium]